MRFLIVDDSKVARKKLEKFVIELNYEVVGHACDGLEAIEKVKEHQPDIITMDLEMPNMKGVQATQEILSLNKNINIILITSLVDEKELIGALKIGVKKVLQKPVKQETFNTTIADLIKGR